MPRRKPDTLLPLEVSILRAGCELLLAGEGDFHGYLIASALKEYEGSRLLTAHGTLYKALDRMRTAGLLESRWEDPDVSLAEGRPRRRLYRVSPLGEQALARAQAEARAPAVLRPGMQPS